MGFLKEDASFWYRYYLSNPFKLSLTVQSHIRTVTEFLNRTVPNLHILRIPLVLVWDRFMYVLLGMDHSLSVLLPLYAPTITLHPHRILASHDPEIAHLRPPGKILSKSVCIRIKHVEKMYRSVGSVIDQKLNHYRQFCTITTRLFELSNLLILLKSCKNTNFF